MQRSLTALAFSLAAAGCGITGNTSQRVLSLEAVAPGAELREVTVASLAREEEGAQLTSVGVFEWGKFDDDDQTNVLRSLEGTLKAAAHGRTVSSAGPVNVYVVIRRYFVAASNREGVVLAGVDWCAADAQRRILFQEAFYAAHHCGFPSICTLGAIKDRVNTAIVERIARSALALAASARPGEHKIDKTYAKVEDAAAALPQTLVSSGAVVPVGAAGAVVTRDIGPVRLALERAAMAEPIDWKRRLGSPD